LKNSLKTKGILLGVVLLLIAIVSTLVIFQIRSDQAEAIEENIRL